MHKIKKYIYLIGITGFLLLSATFIYAQTPNLDQLKKKAQIRASQASQQIKELRDQAQARVKQIKENLQQKISQIKDKKKQDAANKIASQFDRINKVWTDHFTNVLSKLDAVLQKVKSRAEKAALAGKDVLAVNTAIQKAETTIKSAREAVLEQAKKTYIVDVTAITGDTSTTGGRIV